MLLTESGIGGEVGYVLRPRIRRSDHWEELKDSEISDIGIVRDYSL